LTRPPFMGLLLLISNFDEKRGVMSQRSRPEDIEYRHRLKWGSVFQYTTREHSCDDIVVDNYFHNISTRYLRPGDEIHVTVLDSEDVWKKGVFEVSHMDLKNTGIKMIEGWRSGKSKNRSQVIPKKKPLERVA
jgi:hypothetical protein